MGMDIQMLEPPTAAEIRARHLDADEPGYYRFNVSGMETMAELMVTAGVLTEEPAPFELPRTPPISLDPARGDAVEAAIDDPKAEAALAPAELAFARAMRALFVLLRSAPSHAPGRVAGWKFQSNDGWIVTPRECQQIGVAMHAYATQLTPAQLHELDVTYRVRQTAMQARLARPGETPLTLEGFGMTLAEARAWIDDWATYNLVASRHHGYRVD